MPELPKPVLSLGQQVSVLLKVVDNLRTSRSDPRYADIIKYVKDLPASSRPQELYEKLARAFAMSIDEVKSAVDPSIKLTERSFDELIPTHGWLRDYIDYTRFTEPPTPFHFFVGASVFGCALRRNVYFDKGAYSVIPAVCAILVAPSGKCRKTSCCELGISLLRDAGVTVIADKITPEALAVTFSEKPAAQGMIYGGELKVLLGSQKYMEGMIPMLTSLLDQKRVWETTTVARGPVRLEDIAMSFLGATTMDWLKTLPGDAFGGGFMTRFLFIVQDDTPRSFPLPPPLSLDKRGKLVKKLMDYSHMKRNMKLTPGANDWYRTWYNSIGGANFEERQFAGYYERKPDHVLRMAMILSLSEDPEGVLETKYLQLALRILDWTEQFLPAAFETMSGTRHGEINHRLLQQLKRSNGELKYSDWLRKNSTHLKQIDFKQHVQTLRDAKLVDFNQAQGTYYLTPDGWKA